MPPTAGYVTRRMRRSALVDSAGAQVVLHRAFCIRSFPTITASASRLPCPTRLSTMSFEALALTVLIASPGDTSTARDTVESAVGSWNRDRARSRKVVLLPLRWETDAVPVMVGDPQSIINRQLVDSADIVIALFHSRLGAPTSRAPSGTAEEIDRARDRGAPVHVFFSEMPIPRSVDPDELKRLNEFRTHLQSEGLLGSYASLEDLTAKIRTALEHDLEALVNARQTVIDSGHPSDLEEPLVSRAVLRVRYLREGRTREVLIIENLGSAAAQSISIDVEPVGQGEAPAVFLDEPVERLPAQASVRILVAVSMGTAAQWRITIRWHEGSKSFAEVQSVTIF